MHIGIELDHILSVGYTQWTNWRSLRKEILKKFPECQVCGYDKDLEVHHVIPRHVNPELALEWGNLIVLCRDCHFHIGHWCDFQESNPDIVTIATFAQDRRTAQSVSQSYNIFDIGGGRYGTN